METSKEAPLTGREACPAQAAVEGRQEQQHRAAGSARRGGRGWQEGLSGIAFTILAGVTAIPLRRSTGGTGTEAGEVQGALNSLPTAPHWKRGGVISSFLLIENEMLR